MSRRDRRALARLLLLFAVISAAAAAIAVTLPASAAPRTERARHGAAVSPARSVSRDLLIVRLAAAAAATQARNRELHERADDLQHRLTRRVLEARGLRRALVRQPSSLDALRLAATTYGVSFDLLYRRASCESTGHVPSYPPTARHLSAAARNTSSTAKGLGQFLDSTWQSTPYAGFSVFDPYANALAMAWMERQGRGGEWAASKSCWA